MARLQDQSVLIAGGGIGGLTAALALLQRGFKVRVFEQAPELKALGAGIQLSPNGTRPLFCLGLGDALKDVSCEPAGKEIRLWNTGQTWPLFDLGAESVVRYGFPYLMIHRGDLHSVLADAVRREHPEAIQVNRLCSGCSQDETGITLKFVDGSSATGDVLIGADGVHSKIREVLFGRDKPEFLGCLAWRGVISSSRLPARMVCPVGTNWIGPGAHVVHYPLRRGELMNFVGIVERTDWLVESWTERGSVDECLQDFRGWHEDVHTLIRYIEAPFKWALMGRKPIERWTVGRITLLGDACHPTLPTLAQGGVMAIEDAFVLARCLESYGCPETALTRYEQARLARTKKVVDGSNSNIRRFHNPELAVKENAGSFVSREFSEERVRERYNWLFEYDATSVEI